MRIGNEDDNLSFLQMSSPFHKSHFFIKSCVTHYLLLREEYVDKFLKERSHGTLTLLVSILFVWLIRHNYVAPSKSSQCSLSSGFPDLHSQDRFTCVCVLKTQTFVSQEAGTRRIPFTCLPYFSVPLHQFSF